MPITQAGKSTGGGKAGKNGRGINWKRLGSGRKLEHEDEIEEYEGKQRKGERFIPVM